MKVNNKKRKIIITSLIIGIVVSFSFFVIGYKNFLNPNLGYFEIENINEEKDKLCISVTPSNYASSYKVIGYDANGKAVYEAKSDSNVISLDNLYMNYEETISFQVKAFNKNGESLDSNNFYEYISKDLSFDNNLEHYSVKDKDYIVTLKGEFQDEEYYLEIHYEGLLLKTILVESNQVVINKDILNELSGKVVLKLKKGERIVNQFNLYSNVPIVGNFEITNIENDAFYIWDDLEVFYEGGKNATAIKAKLFNNGILVKEKTFDYVSNTITIPADFFEENTTYTLELRAIYNEYEELSKMVQRTINIGEKETVSPVYVDYNFKNIKKDTKISLMTNTNKATIYYTLDGTEPNENSLIYKYPLIISNDIMIKAKAVRKNMFDSEVNTYNFHVGAKPLVVYLSPSNQYANFGVSSVGFSNEMKMMNKLTDYLKPYLESFGVKVYRNNPNTDINTWLNESNYVKSDLHLALHSNGSKEHDAYGIEMYVDNENSKSLSIANKIYNNLYKIYPYKDKNSNRGVKYSKESLGEANDLFIPCGTLIEVAYHDNYNDAKWIVEHLQEIAINIGDSILDYYQVK